MLPLPEIALESETAVYRQLFEQIKGRIESGQLAEGERLPATRELAGQLGLNRATVSAAYELLENAGLITGHVGKGSFVAPASTGINWTDILGAPAIDPGPLSSASPAISFASARPSDQLFPLGQIRATCAEVMRSEEAVSILQLGSPSGYGPLRRFLLEQARQEGCAGINDDILITNGCQQAFDLIQRVLLNNGETVILEDPVYAGVRSVFRRGGAQVVGVRIGADGIDLDRLQEALERHKPRALVLTPTFQNPTGVTMPAAARTEVLRLARQTRTIVVENDIYSALRYEGTPLPALKHLDQTGDTILLRSFSKVSFPGLRVGCVIAPRILIERLTEAKQSSDLHTDQLSQAILLRFAESGRLEAHRKTVIEAGREQLSAALAACAAHLPPGSKWTHPQGGMSLWVKLPPPLDTAELLPRALSEGVSYLPGKHFSVSEAQPGSLRLSFAGLTPREITAGIRILGSIFRSERERSRTQLPLEAMALV